MKGNWEDGSVLKEIRWGDIGKVIVNVEFGGRIDKN